MVSHFVNDVDARLIAEQEVYPIGEEDGKLVLLTARDTSAEQTYLKRFAFKQPVRLEPLWNHPEMAEVFHETIQRCKDTIAGKTNPMEETSHDPSGIIPASQTAFDRQADAA